MKKKNEQVSFAETHLVEMLRFEQMSLFFRITIRTLSFDESDRYLFTPRNTLLYKLFFLFFSISTIVRSSDEITDKNGEKQRVCTVSMLPPIRQFRDEIAANRMPSDFFFFALAFDLGAPRGSQANN